jgi:hypothetical protein
VYTLFGPSLTPLLQFCWRENMRHNKKHIAFLLAWDKDSCTETQFFDNNSLLPLALATFNRSGRFYHHSHLDLDVGGSKQFKISQHSSVPKQQFYSSKGLSLALHSWLTVFLYQFTDCFMRQEHSRGSLLLYFQWYPIAAVISDLHFASDSSLSLHFFLPFLSFPFYLEQGLGMLPGLVLNS